MSGGRLQIGCTSEATLMYADSISHPDYLAANPL